MAFINTFRPDPKPVKLPKVKKAYKYKPKPTGEAGVFEEIKKKRRLVSFIDETPIPNPVPSNFLHVLPKAKNKYPLFKLYEKNIVLGTFEQHNQWDNGVRDELKKLPEWQVMFALEAELKEEYKLLNTK